VRDPCTGQRRNQIRKIDQSERLRHLIEDADALAFLRRIDDRKLDAADGVPDIDEGASLVTAAVHGQRVIDRRFDQETIENSAEVAIIIEAIDQPFVAFRLIDLRAPDDALVKVRDSHAVVLVVKGE
jgi:hypothetical protein